MLGASALFCLRVGAAPACCFFLRLRFWNFENASNASHFERFFDGSRSKMTCSDGAT